MFGKRWLFLAMLAGSTAVPYFLSSTGALVNLLGKRSPAKSDHLDGVGDGFAADPTGAATGGADTSRSGAPVRRIEEVFRFELTSQWVMAQWPRVSAGLAELDLQGYRVPLVSGTEATDLAGSLTYFFDAQQRLQRITFFGFTGDPGKLIALLQYRFGFRRSDASEPSLTVYEVKSWGKVTSELRIRPVPIVRGEAPHARYEVALLIDRPKSMK